jgi:hypothetical protein
MRNDYNLVTIALVTSFDADMVSIRDTTRLAQRLRSEAPFRSSAGCAENKEPLP